jgi:asparagine synthase (glutamine-hydrolysing)
MTSGGEEFVSKMMELDMRSYLPDDIMTKVDRAAMNASLETRAPFLDHRVVTFAASLPMNFKLQGRAGKRVLRNLLYRYVPSDLIDRPKAGFAMPIAEWLRGPLRDWAETLLDEKRLDIDGVFQASPVRRAWEEHLEGTRSWAYQLWDVLMFQAWMDSRRSVQGLKSDVTMQASGARSL